MSAQRPIRSVEELLAHAIAIEREAAARYAELGERMRDLGNDHVGKLFLRLAKMEKAHEDELVRRAKGLRLPSLAPGEYAWLDAGAPETAARGLVLNFLTPHAALQIALEAEQRALAFFEQAKAHAPDKALAALAAEMASDEELHVAWVKGALRRTLDPVINWEVVFSNDAPLRAEPREKRPTKKRKRL